MQKVKLKDLMTLCVETYSGDGFDFTEHTLTTWCSPELVIQFFAFDGLAYNKSGQTVHIEDWDKIPPQVLKEARQTLFTGYTSFLHGKGKSEADGSYLFHCVGVELTVKGGMLSMPNPLHIKKKATNLRKTVLF
jgi:hypothetical protein